MVNNDPCCSTGMSTRPTVRPAPARTFNRIKRIETKASDLPPPPIEAGGYHQVFPNKTPVVTLTSPDSISADLSPLCYNTDQSKGLDDSSHTSAYIGSSIIENDSSVAPVALHNDLMIEAANMNTRTYDCNSESDDVVSPYKDPCIVDMSFESQDASENNVLFPPRTLCLPHKFHGDKTFRMAGRSHIFVLALECIPERQEISDSANSFPIWMTDRLDAIKKARRRLRRPKGSATERSDNRVVNKYYESEEFLSLSEEQQSMIEYELQDDYVYRFTRRFKRDPTLMNMPTEVSKRREERREKKRRLRILEAQQFRNAQHQSESLQSEKLDEVVAVQ